MPEGTATRPYDERRRVGERHRARSPGKHGGHAEGRQPERVAGLQSSTDLIDVGSVDSADGRGDGPHGDVQVIGFIEDGPGLRRLSLFLRWGDWLAGSAEPVVEEEKEKLA